jgi:hypothetical protein
MTASLSPCVCLPSSSTAFRKKEPRRNQKSKIKNQVKSSKKQTSRNETEVCKQKYNKWWFTHERQKIDEMIGAMASRLPMSTHA